MTLSLYDASVPVFTQMLTALSHNLDKAAAYAEQRKFDPAALLGARLFPDMYPLTRQVQLASDNSKGPAARLAGVEAPRFADTETSFAELKDRVARTLDFLAGLDRNAFTGVEDRDIKWMTGGRERVMNGRAYLFSQALPNFFFHVTMAYGILRHNGLEVGKRDFLG